MKENRYFQMLYLLLDKGSMTAPELAEYFEVSVRTIYRDVDILSAAGVPIYATPGKGGGIAIQDNFVLNKFLLSEAEQKQLLMALQGIGITDQENTSSLLLKLKSVFQKQEVNWLEIDFSEWKKSKRNQYTFPILKEAVFAGKVVSFCYYSGKGEAVVRFVEPLKLVFKNMDWFLYGYCCLRNDFRLFKLKRIRDIKLTDTTFKRQIPDRVFGESENFEVDLKPVTLLFDKELSFRVYDEFEEGITVNEDGSLLVDTLLPGDDSLFSYLFSFGDKVEVLEPASIRAQMLVRAANIGNKYRT